MLFLFVCVERCHGSDGDYQEAMCIGKSLGSLAGSPIQFAVFRFNSSGVDAPNLAGPCSLLYSFKRDSVRIRT